MRQTRFFIGASEFEGREGGVRTIILHGRFTGKTQLPPYASATSSKYISHARERGIERWVEIRQSRPPTSLSEFLNSVDKGQQDLGSANV